MSDYDNDDSISQQKAQLKLKGKINNKDADVDDIEEEEENDSNDYNDNEEDENNNEEEEGEQSLSNNNSLNEEELLKDRLDEIEFGKLIKAKTKLEYQNKINPTNKKPKSKQEIMNQLNKVNKIKTKHEPKEYSARIKPRFQMKNHLIPSTLLNKKHYRDPRFDDLSGTLNQDALDKNFNFVKEMAGEYIEKINKFKKAKKNKKKLSEENYDLLKKQTNYVKGWLNHQKQLQEKKEVYGDINKENKKRIQEGKKPIFVKDNAIKKYIKKKKEEEAIN